MLNIACFSPLPPAPTGIADYSRELLEPLSALAKVTLFVERPSLVDESLRQKYRIEPITAYPEARWGFDLALYHMGNSGYYHAAIYEMALRYPGVVVLHEVVLHDFAAHVTLGRGDYAAYAREMGYELGPTGYDQAWQMRLGRQPEPPPELRFSKRLIDRSLGIIVHSHSAAARLRSTDIDRPLAVIPLLVANEETASLRSRLGTPDRTVVFATTGLVNASKRVDLILDAFAQLKKVEPDVLFLIVGGVHIDVNLPKMIRQRNLQEWVHWTGRVDTLEEFMAWTATADVVIQLRHPSLGEASSAAARALATGRPLIVYDEGWYGELPAEVCIQVPSLDSDALLQAMSFMTNHPRERQAMGQAAAVYARRDLDPQRIAGLYKRFLVDVLNGARALTGP
jgi:glycosyltransferase involved in cell wall biosynthesis